MPVGIDESIRSFQQLAVSYHQDTPHGKDCSGRYTWSRPLHMTPKRASNESFSWLIQAAWLCTMLSPQY